MEKNTFQKEKSDTTALISISIASSKWKELEPSTSSRNNISPSNKSYNR